MSDKPRLPDAERILFRSSVGEVVPVRDDKVPPAKPPPRPTPLQTRKDEAQVLKEMLSDHWEHCGLETGEELWFARTGLQHRVLQKLRRGQYSIAAELDLHGMNVPEAREALVAFLYRCSRQRSHCVRIIHGKGRGSRKMPVLKVKVYGWLQQRDEVLAFCSARPAHGGTGALYVLLRR